MMKSSLFQMLNFKRVNFKMIEYKHLHPSCIEKLLLSEEERIQEIYKPRWIGYPSAHKILRQFEDILHHPRVSRMPNALLIGRTNNGKTDLLKKFCQAHLPDNNLSGGQMVAPVIYLQAPPSPAESDFYAAILSSLYERVPSSSTSAKRTRVVEVLRKIGLKVMCVDELHNALAGTSIKQQQFLNMLKYLGNELQISFIGCGTEDVLRAVSIDNQIQNRFPPILLPKWEMGSNYRMLLKTFELVLPLKEASDLHSGLVSKKLYAMTEGTIGELSTLLNQAARLAIQSGSEKITTSILAECGYTSPSERSREAARGV